MVFEQRIRAWRQTLEGWKSCVQLLTRLRIRGNRKERLKQLCKTSPPNPTFPNLLCSGSYLTPIRFIPALAVVGARVKNSRKGPSLEEAHLTKWHFMYSLLNKGPSCSVMFQPLTHCVREVLGGYIRPHFKWLQVETVASNILVVKDLSCLVKTVNTIAALCSCCSYIRSWWNFSMHLTPVLLLYIYTIYLRYWGCVWLCRTDNIVDNWS